MRIRSLIVLCCQAVLGAQISAAPIRLGWESRRLADRDVIEISGRAADYGKAVWILDGDESQLLPETWYIDAYLAPDSKVAGLRRGRVLRLQSVIARGVPVRWRTRLPVSSYAQVAIRENPFPESLTDKSLDRPFPFTGKFTDHELISLVTFLRTSPRQEWKTVHRPDGTTSTEVTIPVEGGWPVTQVTRQGSTVDAVLQDSKNSGQTVTVVWSASGWQLVTVTRWFA